MKLNSSLPYTFMTRLHNNRIKPSNIYKNLSQPTAKESGWTHGRRGKFASVREEITTIQPVAIHFSEVSSGFYKQPQYVFRLHEFVL
jgi:hypothetical protein